MPFDTHRHVERIGPHCAALRTILAALATLFLGSMALAPPAAAKGGAGELDAANSRWRGARCRTRQMIELKKGSDKDGWTKSTWLWWGEPHSNERARVWVSDSDAVRRRFGGVILPIGTELVAKGWKEEDGDLFLELELAGLPAGVKVYFWDDWVGRVDADRIDDFERWVRFDLLEMISTPEEQLIDVGSTTAAAAPPLPSPAPTFPPPPQSEQSTTLRVLSASVEPARAAPGQKVLLIAVYELAGLAPGSEVEVVETRTIRKEGQHLTTIEGRVQHGSGAQESRQSLLLPTSIVPGIYELEVTIDAAGRQARKTAIFEVK